MEPSQVFGSFLEEARGYLPEMRAAIEALSVDPDDRAAVEELHRLAHNMRGAANTIGLPEIGQLAEGLEQLLDQIVEGAIPFDLDLAGLISQGLDQMEAALRDTHPGAVAEGPGCGPSDDLAASLVGGFLIEAEEHLQFIGSHIREVDRSPSRQETLREIRRSVHTIKGAAAMVGLQVISQLAHRMEDLLDQLWDELREFTPAIHRLLLATYDTLSDLVQAGGSAAGLEGRLALLYADYEVLLAPEQTDSGAGAPGLSEPAGSSLPAGQELGPDSAGFVRVPIERLDELMRLVSDLFVQRSVFERNLGNLTGELMELTLSQQRLRRLSQQLESQEVSFLPAATGPGPLAAVGPDRTEFDALEFDRYTQIHLMSRDLNETGNDVMTAATRLDDLRGDLDSCLRGHSHVISEVQERLTRMRMAPLESLSARLHRTVRVAATHCGKEIDFTIAGGATELDQTVLAKLAGPLEHLLRNAADHGIEESSIRLQAGKGERGSVRLSASQEGTDVVIRLSDDGRGLDDAKLREEAVRQGYLSAEEAQGAERQQLHSFIFESGFSTAGQISEISGRGVGLDVVKAAVESLRGSIAIESEAGAGTTFILRLPMRMAIAKVLLVEAHGQRYALPLQAVTEVGRVEARHWERLGNQLSVHLSGRTIQAFDLAVQIGARDAYEPREGRLPVVALRIGEMEFALVVDDILDAREVAVKPMTGVLSRVHAVAGATVLGDGSVVLILNPADLRSRAPSRLAGGRVLRAQTAPARRAFDVLIVDDSLSVRRVVANLVKNTGWNPIQAKDGVEALDVLSRLDRVPDVLLLDIEMPRMDGFELTSRLRALEQYRSLPIIMLTSRSGEKHRAKAFSLGVTDYLVKPYQDEVLVGTIRRLVAQTKVA